jgi:hypothetical protein
LRVAKRSRDPPLVLGEILGEVNAELQELLLGTGRQKGRDQKQHRLSPSG